MRAECVGDERARAGCRRRRGWRCWRRWRCWARWRSFGHGAADDARSWVHVAWSRRCETLGACCWGGRASLVWNKHEGHAARRVAAVLPARLPRRASFVGWKRAEAQDEEVVARKWECSVGAGWEKRRWRSKCRDERKHCCQHGRTASGCQDRVGRQCVCKSGVMVGTVLEWIAGSWRKTVPYR